jgi:hypothetical protein
VADWIGESIGTRNAVRMHAGARGSLGPLLKRLYFYK